jgi:hypothetical protein
MPPPGKNRGGRPRLDGKSPGTPEAKAADLERDRLRKKEERGTLEPAPLPSTAAPPLGQRPPPIDNVVSDPLNAVGSIEVPWTGEDFRQYIDEALSGAEEARVETRKLQAMAAGFSDGRIKEFAADARYPASSKRMIGLASSNGLARIFNKVRFSKDYGEGALAVLAVGMLIVKNKRSDARFKRAVMEFQKKNQPKPEEKKP